MSNHEFFLYQKSPPPTSNCTMPADLELLMIKDLEMLLCLQCKKVAQKAEAKWLAEEAPCAAAEEAAHQAEEEAKAKACKATVAKKWKAMEVVGSDSDAEPVPLQKKGKGKAWVVSEDSMGKVEVAEVACQR
jgi:hypothetical protein